MFLVHALKVPFLPSDINLLTFGDEGEGSVQVLFWGHHYRKRDDVLAEMVMTVLRSSDRDVFGNIGGVMEGYGVAYD